MLTKAVRCYSGDGFCTVRSVPMVWRVAGSGSSTRGGEAGCPFAPIAGLKGQSCPFFTFGGCGYRHALVGRVRPRGRGHWSLVRSDADKGRWFLWLDPWRAPEAADSIPPPESVLGVWPSDGAGGVGRLRVNPDYVPSADESPTDAVDAMLRSLMRRGSDAAAYLQAVLCDVSFEVAMNGDGRALVVRSRDGSACLVVATAESHRRRVSAPAWCRVDLPGILDLLSDGGEVAFNPGGPASVCVADAFLRASCTLTQQDILALYAEFREQNADGCILPWRFGDDGSVGSVVGAVSRTAWPVVSRSGVSGVSMLNSSW